MGCAGLEEAVTRYFIAGGAGFIGSHFTRCALERPDAEVVNYDNFSSGQRWHFGGLEENRV
jgi:nucleoside-diphosphate-sugar epimerase